MYLLKRIVVCLIFILATSGINAQQLTISNSQLAFGNVFENSPDSLPITIQNNFNRTINITGFRFYTTYGAPAFSSLYQYFPIPAGGSVTVWIVFSPRHNVFHNSELVIMNDGLRGNPSVDLNGQGKYSNTYYNATQNLEEQALKGALTNIISTNYLSLGYNVARDSMFMIFDNKFINGQGATQNTLECVYTGREAVGYVDRSDCQNNYSFNTEHTFPQGFFTSLEPMKSDLNHLFPTDNIANNTRGDNPFGVVTNPTWTSGGSKGTNVLFEPRDAQKGKAARALLYFVLRYQDYTNFVNPQETILRSWHQTFLPNAIEQKRNNDVFRIQRNRNPFIDYPQFVERITSICNNSIAPVVRSLDFPTDTINYGTVLPNLTTTFTYTVVNKGNNAVNFSNFSLSNSSVFQFNSGGNDTVIGPGDALSLKINCFTTTSDSVRAFLYYMTDATGSGLLTAPIFANDLVFTQLNSPEQLDFSIYPNPVHNTLNVRGAFASSIQCTIYDLTGRTLYSKNENNTDFNIDVSHFPAGVYQLQLSTTHSFFNKRIIVE